MHSGQAPIVFRGVLELSDRVSVSIADSSGTGRIAWVRVGGQALGGKVESYDAVSRSILFSLAGKNFEVALAESAGFSERPLISSKKARTDSTSSEEVVLRDLIPFASLSKFEQELYNDVKFVDTLINASIEVPFDLRMKVREQELQESLNEDAMVLAQGHSAGSENTRGGPSLPLLGNALTLDEKIARRRIGTF